MGKLYVVRLTNDEFIRATLLAKSSDVTERVRLRATVLLAAHQGLSDQQISNQLETTISTVQRLRKNYCIGGLDCAVGLDPVIESVDPASPENARLSKLSQTWVASTIEACLLIDGMVGAAIIDSHRGLCLDQTGGEGVDFAAAGRDYTEVIRIQLATMRAMQLRDDLEEIILTRTFHHHLFHAITATPGFYLYVIVDRRLGNLGMTRLCLKGIEAKIVF